MFIEKPGKSGCSCFIKQLSDIFNCPCLLEGDEASVLNFLQELQKKIQKAKASQVKKNKEKEDRCFCEHLDPPDMTSIMPCSCKVGTKNYKALYDIVVETGQKWFEAHNARDEEGMKLALKEGRQKLEDFWEQEDVRKREEAKKWEATDYAD